MNEQQKEFAEQLVAEYQSEIDKLYYKINRNELFAVLGFCMAITMLGIGGEFTGYEGFDNLIGVTSGASVIVNGISLVKRIVKREALKQRIREIEYDYIMNELSNEEPKVYKKTFNEKK